MGSSRNLEIGLVILTVVCHIVLIACSEPRLVIKPSQSTINVAAGKPFGLMCTGEAEDADDGTFDDMKFLNPRDEIVPTGVPGTKMYGKSSLKLSFIAPKVEDSGTYVCKALYANTQTLEVKVELNFYEDIKFEECPEVQNLILGEEGRITCRPVGNPLPTINWEKGKMRVKGERIAITPSGITFTKVAQEDAGMYLVEAFVEETGTNSYRNIQVNVLTPPRINELAEELLAIEGEDYTITCNAEGSDPLTYSWYDPQLRNLDNVEGFKVQQGQLTMFKVNRNAGGSYKCKVTNPAGEDEETFRLEVQVRPNIVHLENMTREEGKSAVMECKAEGTPRPTLSIRKDNSYQPLQPEQDDRIEIDHYDEGNQVVLRLRINNLKRSDDGLYYCKASNAAGDVEKAGHIEVQFRPDMSLTTATTVKAWSANPANLSCFAEANPNASITWKFQNDPIEKDDERYRIYGGMSQSSLLVLTNNRNSYEVFGTYTCEARNPLGENSININLEEATAPGQVTQIVFDKVTSTTITFRLLGPGNTGGLPIQRYIMRYKLVTQPEDSTITVEWLKDMAYILSDLKPRGKYQFSVAARNVVGEGPWKSTDYIMPEETVPEPPGIITEQETISDYADRFEVRWDVPNNNGEPIMLFEIRYFKVERGIKGWLQIDKAVERTLRNWDSRPSFELTGLHPDTYYKIEIRATNKIGNSLPESVIIRTRTGEISNEHTRMLDDEPLSLPIIVAIVLVALFIVLVILDVTCFYRYHCGLLYLLRHRTCGSQSEKMQGAMDDGRAWNGNARPADLIIDDSFKNKSPKGSKSSIGKSSPV